MKDHDDDGASRPFSKKKKRVFDLDASKLRPGDLLEVRGGVRLIVRGVLFDGTHLIDCIDIARPNHFSGEFIGRLRSKVIGVSRATEEDYAAISPFYSPGEINRMRRGASS